jgi:hypothetical protein
MSLQNSLTYPPRKQTKRQFHPSWNMPTEAERAFLFDLLFETALMRHIEELSGHGFIPLLIGAALAATGHSQMLVRSLAIIACYVWLSFGMGVWISRNKKWSSQRKAIAFCLCCSMLTSLSMAVMYWFLSSDLEDQRTDAFQNLNGTVSLPFSSSVMNSVFEIKNNSRQIVGPHQMVCVMHRLTSYNFVGPRLDFTESSAFVVGDFQLPLVPGGDAQSEACLSKIVNEEATASIKCIDLTMQFNYVLQNQTIFLQHKEFRFIAKAPEHFVWHQQPILMRVSPCDQMP